MHRSLWPLRIAGLLTLGFQLDIGASDAIAYRHLQQKGPLSVHILEVDPRRVQIRAVRAKEDGFGRQRVSQIALRSGAAAAINGGLFTVGSRYDGLPAGILKIGDQWCSDPRLPRGALGWTKDGAMLIDRLSMRWELEYDGQVVRLNGINRPRGAKSLVLYTPAFGASTMTRPGGAEFLVYQDTVVWVGSYDTPIPADAAVLSLGSSRPVDAESIPLGTETRIRSQIITQDAANSAEQQQRWQRMDYIVGGAGILVRRGQVNRTFSAEKLSDGFVVEKHPRTAVCMRRGGRWLAVVVDGRQPGVSIGLSLVETAELMESLGCFEAINLDGGGSSTLIFDGKLRNAPSDPTGERPVSDAIVFTLAGTVR